MVEITAFRLKSKSCKGFFLQINFSPMRALEFMRDHVTFKLPYDFSYHMKTPYVMMSRNITKSCWQYLTPGFDKMILKICRKLKFHDGFFSCQLNKKANSAHLAAKIHHGILISFIFLKSSYKRKWILVSSNVERIFYGIAWHHQPTEFKVLKFQSFLKL